MNTFEYGRTTEDAFTTFARGRGARIRLALQRDNFDFLLNDFRIEFKAATPRHPKHSSPFWFFNIHHHNVLNEANIDYYVLCFEQIPFVQQNFYGAITAPCNNKTLSFGMPSLLKCAESMNRTLEHILKPVPGLKYRIDK